MVHGYFFVKQTSLAINLISVALEFLSYFDQWFKNRLAYWDWNAISEFPQMILCQDVYIIFQESVDNCEIVQKTYSNFVWGGVPRNQHTFHCLAKDLVFEEIDIGPAELGKNVKKEKLIHVV